MSDTMNPCLASFLDLAALYDAGKVIRRLKDTTHCRQAIGFIHSPG